MKTQLAQIQQKQTFLKILIFTLVTIMVWVGLTLFRTQNRTAITPELLKLAEPLNPNLNEGVIAELEGRQSYTAEELSDFPIYSLVTTKQGEQQLVIFSASDKTRRQVEITPPPPTGPAPPEVAPSPSPAANQTVTSEGATVTVESNPTTVGTAPDSGTVNPPPATEPPPAAP